MLSTGSKGPLIALSLGLLFTFRKSVFEILSKKKFLVNLYLIGMLAIPFFFFLGNLVSSNDTLERFSSFFSGEKEDVTRQGLYEFTTNLIKGHPNGIGVGHFIDYNGLFDYPHNIILETFVEWGWIFGAYFLFLLIISLFVLMKNANNIENRALLGFFVMAVTNAMFSGDITSPKEMYISSLIALNILGVMLKRKKIVNKTKENTQISLINSTQINTYLK
jgi:O-antigen ligase